LIFSFPAILIIGTRKNCYIIHTLGELDLTKPVQKVSAESYSDHIHAWKTVSPELRAIYEIAEHISGIYGCGSVGQASRGCCMALIDPAYKEAIEEQMTREYLEQFPQYKDLFSVHFCNTDDGVKGGFLQIILASLRIRIAQGIL
jgi:galactokinase